MRSFPRPLAAPTLTVSALMLLGALLAGCADGGGSASPTSRTVIEGGPMKLQPVAVDAAVSRLSFRSGSAPVWLDEGRIAIADKDAGQVVVLGIRSGVSSRMGRRGMGPGEMLLPMWIVPGPDGAIVVGDGLGMRVTEFAVDGRAGRTASFPGRPLAVTGWSGDTVTAVWIDGTQPVVGAVDLGSGAAVERFRPFAVSPVVVASAASSAGPSLFLSAAAGEGDRVLLSGGWSYDVVSFEPAGRVARVFSRPDVVGERMSEGEFAEFSESLTRVLRVGGSGMMQHRDEVLAQARARPKPFFRAGGLSMDSRGRLWVVTSHRTPTGTAVDVFSPDGTFLTRLDLPGKVGSVTPHLPHVAVLREGLEGELEGVEGVDVYRVEG